MKGYHIHTLKEGKNGIVVALHGLTNTGLGFLELAQKWPDETILAVDLPCHGQSARREDLSLETIAADVAAWIRTLQEPVTLIGHSWGAMVSLFTASVAPEAVKGMIWIDGGFQTGFDRLRHDPDALNEAIGQWIDSTRFATLEEAFRSKESEIGRWSPALQRMTEGDMKQEGEEWTLIPSKLEAQTIAQALVHSFDHRPYEQVHVPLLAFIATLPEEENPARAAAIESLKASYGGPVEVVQLPETGHVLHWQQPDAVINALIRWKKMHT